MLTLEQKEKVAEILGWKKTVYNMLDDGMMLHDVDDVDKIGLLVKKIEELADETFTILKTDIGWKVAFWYPCKKSSSEILPAFVKAESFVDTLQLAILKLDEVKNSDR